MPGSKALPQVRLRFRTERMDEIAAAHGLVREQDKAIFFGVSPSSFSRVVNGHAKPGEDFIAAVLAARPEETFESLFEVVAA